MEGRGALDSESGAPPRLMLPHTFRIEGIVFVVAMALGKLPALFAVPAGFGDIAVGVATLLALHITSLTLLRSRTTAGPPHEADAEPVAEAPAAAMPF